MQVIPLTPVPAQNVSIVLNNQNCALAFRTRLGNLYCTLSVGGVPIITNRICRNLGRLMLDAQYQPFIGDIAFIDTQGNIETGQDPVYTGLGSRFLCVYLLPAELQ